MPTLNQLKGLRASDRTKEEQKAINQQMGYKEEPEPVLSAPAIPIQNTMPLQKESEADTPSAAMINQIMRYKQHMDEQYQQTLAERERAYGVDRSSANGSANDYLDSIANEVSSYYKKFKNTDKLPLDNQERKQLAAEYDAKKETYGQQNADVWLDNYFKNKVGENQSWFEQMTHAVSHLVPAIEGGIISTYGMLHGAVNHILGTEGYDENDDLNWWDSFINDVIDNPVTRYGRDMELAGASHVSDVLKLIGLSDQTANERIAASKATATRYNPEGLGEDAIVTTDEQDGSVFSSATPWQALQSGGFTALSMLTGAAEAKAAGWIFNGLARGANWLNKTNKIIKTEKGLERTLEGLKRAQNFTDIAIIPGAVGSVEGALEGLNTKIEVERNAVNDLDEYYRNKVNKEAEELYNNEELNPLVEVQTDQGKTLKRAISPEEAFQQTWDKYQNEYIEARRQIDWASSKAGIHNFWTNSMINGMINSTLKAGLMAPRVQETLRNSRMFGWAYKNPKFDVTPEGATAKVSKLGLIKQVLKEPLGEGSEEYLQSLSSDVFSSAAENNINEFIKNKFEGDGTAKIADSFSSDYAAALTALNNSLTSKESIESAILGAVSSTMGTVGGIGKGYHRDEKGRLIQNSMLDPRNLRRGLDSNGKQEGWMEYMRRVTPWRSGAVNAYYDAKREQAEAEETAATITEWLKDPVNKAKWDGLQGTAEWMSQMENAAESNDQFSYRKAQMGKAVNDVLMLKKLEGTDFYESIIADLQKAANGEISQEDIAKLKQNGGEDYQGISDQEVVEKVQSNANKMLGLMSQVEQESRNLDRLLGRADEDTKQSLIYGKIMEQNFRERREQLREEIANIKSNIQSSRISIAPEEMSEEIKGLILKYGTVNKALKEASDLQEQKEKTEKKIQELEAIDSNKISEKQKEDLAKSKKHLKTLDKELEGFNALKNREGQIDSSWSQMVLNEEEIMNLDPVTRAMVLVQGAAKYYNATHQNRQRIDQLNQEIDEIDHQIDALESQKASWMSNTGKVKKGHNKQVERNNSKIAELQKQKESKMRVLDAEQGKQDTKPVYSSQQQEVIDNLVQQGMAQDENFLDKVIDMGRLQQGIRDYHSQYQAVLSDPKAFQNYVQRARYNAKRDLTRRRAERISRIENFQEYSQELDRLTANASQQEMNEIFATLRAEDARQKKDFLQNTLIYDEETDDYIEPTDTSKMPKTNYDRYVENTRKQGDLVRQFAKNPNLTDNDQSLLMDAMQYLASKGIDVTDREAAVEALIERDEQGNQGGKFRQFVEGKNAERLTQQQTFMPVFTSIGQVVGQYVDLINGQQQDAINRGNIQPLVIIEAPETTSAESAPAIITSPISSPTPTTPEQPQAKRGTIFDIAGGSTAEVGHFVDKDGTVATDAQTKTIQQRQSEEGQSQREKTERQVLFERVTTPEIAKTADESANLIDNSNESDAVKGLALQYLEDVAVNNDETYSTIDDFLDALQGQINKLKARSDMEEEEENDYSKAVGLLNKVYGSLNAKKIRGRGRTIAAPSTRPVNPRASWIHTANIAYMEQQNPDAWAVRFTNDHAIDEWNRNHTIDRKEPIYFITDSEWTADVTTQMNNTQGGRNYNTLIDMPIIAAVRVETPSNPYATTAVEINGLWYQPIGVMPSSASTSVQGAAMTEEIRKVASKEQGRHLVTANGLPNGTPLITHVYGVNYLTMHHPDASGQTRRQNAEENNTNVIDGVINTLSKDSQDRLRAMPKQEMLNDPEYQEARSKFLNGLEWNGEGAGIYENQISYTPDNRREGETGNPMLVFSRPMSETIARDSEQTLPEVLENETTDQVVTFNSRTERLYNEIIRPLFQYLPMVDKRGDRSARLITQQDLDANPNAYQEEADRITKVLKGFVGTKESSGIRGISDFIFINPKSGWSIKVTTPEAMQKIGDVGTSESVYKIFFVNEDPSIAPIELGEIRVNANSQNIDNAKQFLKNLMWDSQTGQVRDFLNWQVPKADAQNLKNPDSNKATQAKRNYAAIVDDGILTFAGSSLVYDVDGVKLNAPITSDGMGHTRIVYPQDTVSNANNAQNPTPQNQTPQGDGTVVAEDGSQVLEDSGATVGEPTAKTASTPAKSEKLKRAEETTRRIIEDSKQFTLSEDDTYYYITDNTTGKETKYLRVTTIIGADESVPQWTPTIQEIYNKLRERHTLAELDVSQVNSFKDINHMSLSLGIPVGEIRRAVAELRTEHKKEKYGAWGIPSTSVGNTVDTITRDFLAGHLKHAEQYPNITEEAFDRFVQDLTMFREDLRNHGIHIVSEGVMAHGKITMTDEEGNSHEVNVAGTLDLFGYDENGNFYIFDMKSTRNHSQGKLLQEKDKWSRQISMYADLLKQSYGIEVSPNNLRIIPINIDYPTPMGSRNDNLDPRGPQYSETSEGQLQMTYRGENESKNFDGSNPRMRGTMLNQQFQPGYTPFNINWDNLSSEDQDIASALITQTGEQNTSEETTPITAHIDTPRVQGPVGIDMGIISGQETMEASPQLAPIVPNGQSEVLPRWGKLSNAIRGFLIDEWGVSDVNAYNEMLNNPADVECLIKDLKCRGLM